MAEPIIFLPDKEEHEHECNLPWAGHYGYGDTGLPDYTLANCSDCGRWHFAAPHYESYGPTQKWRKVRLWHWVIRRRIRRLCEEGYV